jgi:homoserine O-acetyltransferase
VLAQLQHTFQAFAGSAVQYLHTSLPFALEAGPVLPGVRIAYQTWGTLNPARDNVVWVCHALTANADAASWWPNLIGPGAALDTDRYFVVCANLLGGCYGTTGPLDTNPTTDETWGIDFPLVTIRDQVAAHQLLAEHLAIDSVDLIIGGSMGGQQALEWAVQQPERFRRMVVLATNARHSAWGIAFNAAQRLALEADPTLQELGPTAGQAGLAAARSIAMLSYRGYVPYTSTQTDTRPNLLADFAAESYQRYQGQKLVNRFSAHSYWVLSRAMDSHDLGRNRGPLPEVLAQIQARTTVISISSDLLFPPEEQALLAQHIPTSKHIVIDSPYGHDGFLVETERIGQILLQL